MKNMALKSVLFTCTLAFIALSAGCEMENNATCTITNVGWYIENNDPSYYTSASDVTCRYYFSVDFEGSAVLSDIQSARINTPDLGGGWSITLDSDHYDAANKALGGYFVYTPNNDVVPIGRIIAAIVLKNGKTSQLEIMTHEPGTTTASGTYQWAYSDDYSTANPVYIRAVHQAQITGHTIDKPNQELTIDFTADDSRIYGGWVWFFSADHTYLGRSNYFRNSTDGVLRTFVNGGASLNTTGANTLTITSADILFSGSYTFSNIAEFLLITTDGGQFAASGRYTAYDYRACSVRTVF